MPIKGPILLYGAGREAISTRAYLAKNFPELEVHVCVDKGEINMENTPQIPVEDLGKAFAEGRYATLVRSPGVSIYKGEIIAAKEAGVHVTTNVNIWAEARRGDAKVIAITGTKGKSTTAKLIHTILKTAGFDIGLGGNIGVPPLEMDKHKFYVLELSSFQCADLRLNPDFIGITSLFPEHLDWHRNEEQYFNDKLRILRRMAPYQCVISPQATSHYSLPQPPKELVHAAPELSEEFEMALDQQVENSKLKGAHNLQNALLAARICLGVGASEPEILEGIADFVPLPHRLQEYQTSAKIFVNDSIATNPQATKAAILSYSEQNTALIVGGFDRGQNYSSLANCLRNADITSLWLLPDTGHRIIDMLDREEIEYPIHQVDNLADIFVALKKDPDQFDVLLLSPGAPSFNQFDNFEQRGDTFLTLANEHFGD